MQEIFVRNIKPYIIQIATPYSRGTGFYLPQFELILTNEHIVRDNREVIIDGTGFEKQLTQVIYLDDHNDLAFLNAPKLSLSPIIISDVILTEGIEVLAIGHSFGANFCSATGTFAGLIGERGRPEYIYHTASLNPGNSGGPLLNDKGELIGINTFLIDDDQITAFALPVKTLLPVIQSYKELQSEAIRCSACGIIVSKKESSNQKCPGCYQKIIFASDIDPYEPVGVAKAIEEMLSLAGYQAELSRLGPGNWEIQQGSAQIHISYYDKTGLIIGDAYLCTLPPEHPNALFEFLLKQNYEIEGLTFSIREQDIVLSLLIYDRYLNVDTGKRLFKHLFEMADHYDDLLVDRFGAQWSNRGQFTERE